MASSNESDDEELKYAIALSLQSQAGIKEQNEVLNPVQSDLGDAGFTMRSLNRKKMEEERLARRVTKHGRSNSQDDDVVEIPAPKRRVKSPTRALTDHVQIPYPDGVVKRTWARGYNRSDDDIQIEEVLQRDKLLLALFSSFQWDEQWLLQKLDVSRTKVLLAAFAANDSQKEYMRRNAPENVRFCFPPMSGPGCMHSKLQILKFPNYLRIVVPTGNLVPFDWAQQMVFLIDLPLLNSVNESPQMTLFQSHLQQYLQAMGVDAGMISSLSKYDFTKTTDLGFVYSIPGGHVGSSLSRVGFAGLGTTIEALGLASVEPIEVDFACSSLGALKFGFVRNIYRACQGLTSKDLLETDQKNKVVKEHDDSLQLQQHFRIYFPSHSTVISSRGGELVSELIVLHATEQLAYADEFRQQVQYASKRIGGTLQLFQKN
ncbi:hypothetical protein E4U41_003924 [Claviceps citrina]|nr:hypothetical protein E4U41_003924 [Claviceps citrina]